MMDMPPAWPPKLFIDKEDFLRGSPMGEVTRYYIKSRVDLYTDYTQIDGQVKRLTLYEDYKRIIVREIRYLYNHRRDNLRLRRRFPFEFKTIDHYIKNNKPTNPNMNWPHWKEIQEIDRRSRLIKFYPLRHQDGLIEREEIIGKKTIERYINRDDFMTYRSVRFEQNKGSTNAFDQYEFRDSHVGEQKVAITKMSLKFECNRHKPANEQIARMIIDLKKNRISMVYHMAEGEIAPFYDMQYREHITGQATISDNAEKKVENPEEQIRHQKIYTMEKDCFSGIKTSEQMNFNEIENHKVYYEGVIANCRVNNNIEEAQEKILEETLHDKARKKYNEDLKKRDDEGVQESHENDILYPFLQKDKHIGKVLTMRDAMDIKKQVLEKFRERIIARADIIHRRIEQEKQEVEAKTKAWGKRSTENIDEKDEKNFEDEINRMHFRIKILNQ